MKLNKNQIAVFQETFEDCSGGTEYGELLYFFADDEIKKLRSNSKNFHYWDGNNWKHITIQFVEIIEYENYEEYNASPFPQYCFERTLDTGLILKQSNLCGHLTPYWLS